MPRQKFPLRGTSPRGKSKPAVRGRRMIRPPPRPVNLPDIFLVGLVGAMRQSAAPATTQASRRRPTT